MRPEHTLNSLLSLLVCIRRQTGIHDRWKSHIQSDLNLCCIIAPLCTFCFETQHLLDSTIQIIWFLLHVHISQKLSLRWGAPFQHASLVSIVYQVVPSNQTRMQGWWATQHSHSCSRKSDVFNIQIWCPSWNIGICIDFLQVFHIMSVFQSRWWK